MTDAAPAVPRESQAPARVVEREPALNLLGLLASCLVVVVAFSPILFGGKTLSAANEWPAGTNGEAPFPGQPRADYLSDYRIDPGASSWQSEPWAEVSHRAYARGEWPLWNPYQGLGAPLGANMSSAVFDPLLLAVHAHPTPLTWDLSIIGAFILGAAAAYLFGRVLGLRVVPAVVSSAAFSLSGWFFLYSNNAFSRSYVLLPVLFLMVELSLRSRRLWPVLALGLTVAESIYMGMPEASFFVIGSAAVYAAARLVQERTTVPMRISVARLGGASLLGLALAAPLVLLFLEYEPLSFSIHKPEDLRGAEADPAWDILDWLGPFFPGSSTASPNSWFGSAVVVSTLVALSGHRETKRLHSWLFLMLGLFLLVKSYDFHALDWVGHLPVANLVVFPIFGAPVISFMFAVLAGIGVQVLWNGDLRVRRFLTLVGLGLLLLAGVLGAGDRLRVIVEERQTIWGRVAFFAVLAIAAALAASWFGRRWAASALAGVIILELFWLAPVDIYAQRAEPYRTPGWMSFVRVAQRGEAHSRVFGTDSKLYPNTAGALGLQDIRALDAMYIERYLRYVRTFVQPEVVDDPTSPRFTGTEANSAPLRRNPMFDALGVRAVLSSRDLEEGTALRFVGRDASSQTRVYENTDAYPRAWVVHNVHVVDDEDTAFGFLTAHASRKDDAFIVDSFDPRWNAVVENRSNTDTALRKLQGGRQVCASRTRDRATILRYAGDSVSLRVESRCPGLLVLPDTYFPGWKATVNGREEKIYPTDGAFRGVAVPEGTSRVEFRYEPRAMPMGGILAAIGLAGFFVIGSICRWAQRRRGPMTS